MTSTEISAGTRERILDAAWARVRDGGAGAASVKAIAADAGVSRQLVYFHYRNRAGLLLAMARHRDRTSGFAGRVRDGGGSCRRSRRSRRCCGPGASYLPELTPVARALEAALIAGDEGGEAWTDRMGDLHAILRAAADRVAGAGRLAPGWTAADRGRLAVGQGPAQHLGPPRGPPALAPRRLHRPHRRNPAQPSSSIPADRGPRPRQ